MDWSIFLPFLLWARELGNLHYIGSLTVREAIASSGIFLSLIPHIIQLLKMMWKRKGIYVAPTQLSLWAKFLLIFATGFSCFNNLTFAGGFNTLAFIHTLIATALNYATFQLLWVRKVRT